jgi:tetratricopeptide (TPR) repeat protein
MSTTTARTGGTERGLALLLILFLIGSLSSRAAAPSLSFEAANQLYEGGKFTEAAAAYEKLPGPPSASLYFNLGNAYFKSGQIGRAIAAYRQAEKLTPRDPDVRANLQFSRNQIQGPTMLPSRSQRWLSRLTLNEWTSLACAALWLWLLVLALLQWRPSLRPSLRGFVLGLAFATVVSCACLAAAWSATQSTQTAIVVTTDAAVHNGPFDESPTAFHLNDGAELRVLDQQHDWLQVTADGRRSGWLRRDKTIL